MTIQPHDGSSAPARLPNSLSAEAEFLVLMDLKLRTEERLNAIVQTLCPGAPSLMIPRVRDHIIREMEPVPPRPVTLPGSGLRQAAPGVLLFKGGRHA